MHTNAPRYDRVAVFLHWTIALLIIGMIAVGLTMEDYPISIRFLAINLHKSFGLTILALSLFRLYWRLRNPAPPLPEGMSSFEQFAAKASHWFFYFLIIAMPLSGWLFVSAYGKYPTVFFTLFEVPHLPVAKALGAPLKIAHYYLAMGTLGLLALHIAAALKHHFINHDTVLRRMLPLWVQRRGRVVL